MQKSVALRESTRGAAFAWPNQLAVRRRESMAHSLRGLLCALVLGGVALGQVPHITKVDPPNWWAKMPKPMLLVKGEHLEGATFRLSDRKLHVERTVVSQNGHWAQVWLSGSPEKAETVNLIAEGHGATARMEYRFEQRKEGSDGASDKGGFAGFSSKDAMYLIMTDRFADGDPSNDQQPGDE